MKTSPSGAAHGAIAIATATAIALATAAVAAVAAGAAATEAVVRTPLEVPAGKSALAIRAPLNAIGLAGTRLVVAGQRGHILYSDDNGKAWVQAEVPVSADLTALHFATPKLGWAVGHEGVVLHTTDGGASWQLQLDGRRIGALLAGQGGAAADAGADKPLLDVWFENEQQGWAVGSFNLILRTEDGGRSWTPWSERTDNAKGMHLYALRPAGGTLVIVGEQGLVLKLDRGKQRFVNVPLPYKGTLFGVVGDDQMTLVFGLRGNAWRSTDAGATWTKAETGVAAGLTSALVRKDGSVVLVSQAGHVLQSSDHGATFSRVDLRAAAPTFALAETAGGAIALAGIGGVRIEAVKPGR